MRKILITLLLMFAPLFAQTTDGDGNAFGIKFSGYVKTDVIYDTRQTVAVREGHLLLYPANKVPDQNGKDINDVANFNMLAIQTRLTGKITAPDFLGAKTSGLIEAAFFGHTDSDINGLRLRHAFMKLDWETMSLLVGQYWHPMFITEVYPDVISFNTGMPFQPFSRNPQIKFIYRLGNFNAGFTALAQRDFSSTGPDGASSSYLRNAGLPVLDLNLKFSTKNIVAGLGANYMTLLPKQQEIRKVGEITEKYITDTKISSFAFLGFAKAAFKDFVVKAEGVYGGNLTDLVMLGGYAVSEVDQNGFVTEYTAIKTTSAWTELIYGKTLQYAIFAGYTKNLGADDPIVGAYYSRGNNIASVMRIAPRVQYSHGKTRYAAELEYTAADYGTPDLKGVVKNTASLANLRFLVGVYLFF